MAAAAQYARLLRVFSLLDAFVPPRPEAAATPAGLVLTAAQVRVPIESKRRVIEALCAPCAGHGASIRQPLGCLAAAQRQARSGWPQPRPRDPHGRAKIGYQRRRESFMHVHWVAVPKRLRARRVNRRRRRRRRGGGGDDRAARGRRCRWALCSCDGLGRGA
eukprot:COSAG01_NODE_1024_length_12058_cov_91.598211_10_plen_162_part_00